MSELTQKTLREIAKRGIHPESVWKSRLKNSLYWIGASGLILFSALATAISFHSIFEIDWSAYWAADFTWLQILVSGVPFFSIILFIVFLFGGVVFLQRTRRGYRYSSQLLCSLFLMTSVAMGYFIEESPLDEPTERFLLRAIPRVGGIQASLMPSSERQWSQPKYGLLGGAVLSSGATDLVLIDASQKLWTVDYSQAEMESQVRLNRYDTVKIVGSQDGEDTFQAKAVQTWDRDGKDGALEKTVLSTKKKDEDEKQAKKDKEREDADEDEKEEKEEKKEDSKDEDEDEEEEDEKDEDGDEDDEPDTESHD